MRYATVEIPVPCMLLVPVSAAFGASYAFVYEDSEWIQFGPIVLGMCLLASSFVWCHAHSVRHGAKFEMLMQAALFFLLPLGMLLYFISAEGRRGIVSWFCWLLYLLQCVGALCLGAWVGLAFAPE